MIKKDFEYYISHQPEITDGHLGEYVVIKDSRVVGYFKEEYDAFEAMKSNKLGTFLVKKCRSRGSDIVTFYNNRVSFA